MPQRVCYFYDGDVSKYYYGPGHPMKPHRLTLTHHLLLGYGLYKKMEIYRPRRATEEDLRRFHSDDYVDFLRRIAPDNVVEYSKQLQRFNVGEDCPVFDGLFDFCQIYAGASLDAAHRLVTNKADIAINYSGGLHHAKRGEASGFCYVNDIVLAILELLRYHPRVMYIDIDLHHGDGVEEAFYCTDRVMCLSFHKFGDFFFPGTGDVTDVGAQKGKFYSVNFPLKDGITDEMYEHIFRPVVAKAVEVFQPTAIVMQTGADSLTGDRLGWFNLSTKGHAACVGFVKGLGIPLVVVGGGGYNIRNVARCWTYETSVLLGQDVSPELPFNDYWHYFGPDFKLHVPQSPHMENLNRREELEKIKQRCFENLRQLRGAPSVQFQDIPPSLYPRAEEDLADEERDPEARNKRTEAEFKQKPEPRRARNDICGADPDAGPPGGPGRPASPRRPLPGPSGHAAAPSPPPLGPGEGAGTPRPARPAPPPAAPA
eukprot:tig00001307_g8127.t1